MLDQYERELARLIKDSEDKKADWPGWSKIETLEEIISKYKLFDKIS